MPRPERAPKKPVPGEKKRPALASRLESLGRRPLSFVLTSILLLVPCFWQSRIHAGDLSSHIYNAWLVQLVASGKTIGLTITSQLTNVLTDFMLSGLFRAFGADAAQRITVAVCVLVFFWGAFTFVAAVSGGRRWSVVPLLLLLAYGWTFHMGFFNMYLSLGLCLFAMAAAWQGRAPGFGVAAVLLSIAYVAHGLPVAWAVAVLVYRAVALRLDNRARLWFAAGALAAIVLLRIVLNAKTETRWLSIQLVSMTGADQAIIYDFKYWVAGVGVLFCWVVWLVRLGHESGWRSLLSQIPVQVAFLSAAGVAILPTGISIPGYNHLLSYIAMRMSLGVAVCYCAMLAQARPPAIARFLSIAVMLLYFGFVYRDSAILNVYEDRLTSAVDQFRGARLILGFDDQSVRVNPFTHMIDRACLGVCYSYGNYEPSTAQFRLRVTGPNPFVASNYVDAWKLENGLYVVKPTDIPLYRVDLGPDGGMRVRPLSSGRQTGMTLWTLLR